MGGVCLLARKKNDTSPEVAKGIILDQLRLGGTVKSAIKVANRSIATYESYRSKDKQFALRVDTIRAARAEAGNTPLEEKASDFASFRKKYLGMETFPHQQMWIDLIEGKTLEGLHPSIIYEPGSPQHILINCPPEFSKSMTLSIDYVTYRVCMDPNVKIMLVSKTQEFAKQLLYAVKQRLTHPRYAKLQLDFAPMEGFKGPGSVWQSDRIYLGNEARDSDQKDPTILALGIGGQVYGQRSDLILLDDCVVLSNCMQYEGQLRWIQQEVATRTGPAGKIIVTGTRVDAIDLYKELRNPQRYPDGKGPWTYLAQPAVLEFADNTDDWVTLWPKSNVPWAGLAEDHPDNQPDEDGLYPRWNGKYLYRRRGILNPKTWSMVYQQQDSSDDAIFNLKDIMKCVNGNRTVGLLKKDNAYHRKGGMDGLYVICSMDPAMAGETASICYAVDMKTQKRFVLDANRMPSPTPQQIKQLIYAWTDKYDPRCWVVEKNAFQLFLTRDEEIRSYLANKGCAMQEHYTGNNKLDPDFGVASLAPLFSEGFVELPSSHNSEGVKALIEQLITWVPGVKGKDLKMDLPMAMWFAEIKARTMIEQHTMKSSTHFASKYTPRYRQRFQNVVYLDDLMQEAM